VKMKSIFLLIALLFAISEARNIRLNRPLISYEDHVLRGGLPLPQAIRDEDPGYWYRHQLEDRNVSTNIVGGVDATLGQIPHIISLRRTSHSCGGSILSQYTIITAAHCVSGANPSVLSIRYGSLLHGSGGTIVQIARTIVHEGYNSGTINNDLALLYPSTAIIYGQQAQPVALVPQGHDPQAGDINVVSGWGTTSESGSLSATLKTVNIPTVSRAACNTQYGSGRITETMYCAGIAAGGIDACQGDSGGPYDIGGQLAGLTSWGTGCARPTHAGVATRVGFFTNWVNARLE